MRQAQQKNNALAQQLEQSQRQHEAQTKQYKKQLRPFTALQKQLTKQQRSLRKIDQALQQLITDNALEGLSTALMPGRLVVRLDNKTFFGSSFYALTKKGREALELMAPILKQHPDPYIDVNGNTDTNAPKENWKNSTRHPLVVVYLFTKLEVLPQRFRIVGQGEQVPLTGLDVESNRTELIFHFQPQRAIEGIPLR